MMGDRLSRAAGLSLLALSAALAAPSSVLAASPTTAAATAAPTVAAPATAAPASATAAPAAAATITPVVIVVDADGVMQQSSAAKAIETQIETQRNAYQSELSRNEASLRQEEQTLAKQQSTMTAQAFDEKRRAFEQKVANFQRDVQTRRRALDQGYGAAIDQVKRQLLDIVSKIATERKANLVLYKSQLILYDTSYDVSEEALKRLNAALPKVTVNIPRLDEVAATDAQAVSPIAAVATPPVKAKKK